MNQHELAKALGVSQYTVSVALGGKGRVSDKTRQRVLDAAREMGYQINPLAAGLRGGKTSTIGIIWHFVDPWAGDAMIALKLLNSLQERGYTIYQAQQAEDPAIMIQQMDGFLSRRVDAVLVRGTPTQLLHPEFLERCKPEAPVVALCREELPEFPGDLIVHDREKAIRDVVKYLAQTGRRKPCFALSLAQESNPSKFDAFKAACNEFGIAEHPKLLLDLEYPSNPEDTGTRHAKAIEHYFETGVDVDAIFAFNDVGAMYMGHALKKRGVRIPEDVAIIGFNNVAPASVWSPPLASGDRKFAETAAAMERMLVRKLEEPELAPQRETIHMDFVWRESAGPQLNCETGVL